jgi:hypothetical protein
MTTINDAVAAYMKLRSQKEKIEAAVKEDLGVVKAKMDKLEAWLKVEMDKQGLTSVKSKYGTAFLTTTDYANVEKWDAVLEFVKQHSAYDLLEKRVSKIAVRGYIEQYKAVPPGVTYGTKLEVNIRKPTAKAED